MFTDYRYVSIAGKQHLTRPAVLAIINYHKNTKTILCPALGGIDASEKLTAGEIKIKIKKHATQHVSPSF